MNMSLDYFLNKVWEEKSDERMAHYPILSDGPWTILTIIGLYLYFVKVWGPKYMEKRAPFQLTELMICYNFIMVAMSGWMFYEGSKYTNFGLNTWKCPQPDEINDRATRRFLFVAWLFLFSKLIEFADTIFMVLRKKNSHISNLHVIHHSVVPLSVWLGLKFEPLGPNNFFPLVNSFIHTVMYSYYGLTAFHNCGPNVRQKLNLFKPWMTRLQIFQFCLAILHCLVTVSKGCHYLPKTFLILNLGNAILFLALFFNFYHNSYRKGSNNNSHLLYKPPLQNHSK